ncbi:Lrp/AsnC family transcriptional regulator [Aquabacterium sp.]|uniref:siroheme decarboxylase subunit beta n=1 Tax=Aquabacterium sp. TaxID=1872578 RepID=UPI003784DA46
MRIAPDDWRHALLNRWQRDFPLERAPFARIGSALGRSEDEVLDACRALQQGGALSRIGGIFAAGAGGAALLAAMAVPAARLEAVAALVSAHPGVNHNYEREHRFNLWFVVTGRDGAALERVLRSLEQATGLAALRLPMLRAYRIDLGFDLQRPLAPARVRRSASGADLSLAASDWPLAALVEDGLPLLARPFDAWAQALGRPPQAVIDALAGWLAAGALRRFGCIVRHHELGFAANAMTVFDVPNALVDACGAALAQVPGVTLAYRRERAAGWPYNLYCMVHGRERAEVLAVLRQAVPRCGLAGVPQAVLFSRRRFKQTGAWRFRELPAGAPAPHTEGRHVAA